MANRLVMPSSPLRTLPSTTRPPSRNRRPGSIRCSREIAGTVKEDEAILEGDKHQSRGNSEQRYASNDCNKPPPPSGDRWIDTSLRGGVRAQELSAFWLISVGVLRRDCRSDSNTLSILRSRARLRITATNSPVKMTVAIRYAGQTKTPYPSSVNNSLKLPIPRSSSTAHSNHRACAIRRLRIFAPINSPFIFRISSVA